MIVYANLMISYRFAPTPSTTPLFNPNPAPSLARSPFQRTHKASSFNRENPNQISTTDPPFSRCCVRGRGCPRMESARDGNGRGCMTTLRHLCIYICVCVCGGAQPWKLVRSSRDVHVVMRVSVCVYVLAARSSLILFGTRKKLFYARRRCARERERKRERARTQKRCVKRVRCCLCVWVCVGKAWQRYLYVCVFFSSLVLSYWCVCICMTEHKKDHHPVRVEQKFIPENEVGGSGRGRGGGSCCQWIAWWYVVVRGGDAQDER